jgi:hypothetical protein
MKSCAACRVPLNALVISASVCLQPGLRSCASVAGSCSPATIARTLAWPVVPVISLSTSLSWIFIYIPHWKHNGYWFFNDIPTLQQVATQEAVDLESCTIFYYEVYDQEFDAESNTWKQFKPEPSFETCVAVPQEKQLEGYDVVTFSVGTSPECSPLSCNQLAEHLPVNPRCLLATFEEAKRLVQDGVFDTSEPGPYRIFAIFSCKAADVP